MTKREERARRMRAYELAKSVAAANFADCTDEEQLDVVEEILAFADEVRAEALREAAARILDTTSRGSAHEGLILANRVVNDMVDRLTPAEKPAPVTYRAGTVPPRIEVGMVLRFPNSGVSVRIDEADDESVRVVDPIRSTGGARYSRSYFARWLLARDWTEPAAVESYDDVSYTAEAIVYPDGRASLGPLRIERAAARDGSEAAGEAGRCGYCEGEGRDHVGDDAGWLMVVDCPACTPREGGGDE